MSNFDQGAPPGWWRASDGYWYPPAYTAPPWSGRYPTGNPGQGGGWGPPPGTMWAQAAPYRTWSDPGNGLSIAGIICGAIAFLFLPIILGPAGLILGGIGLSRKESKAPIAMVVSACGLVVGMILGMLVYQARFGV